MRRKHAVSGYSQNGQKIEKDRLGFGDAPNIGSGSAEQKQKLEWVSDRGKHI